MMCRHDFAGLKYVFMIMKTQEHLNVLFGVFLMEYIENFTNKHSSIDKVCFVSFPNC